MFPAQHGYAPDMIRIGTHRDKSLESALHGMQSLRGCMPSEIARYTPTAGNSQSVEWLLLPIRTRSKKRPV